MDKTYTVGDILAGVGKIVTAPAAAALETISYLDKPRGAIAGTVKAAQEDSDLWEGAKKGWRENTSWKETFNQDWVKENPTTAAIAGFATDVAFDPLWFIKPATVAGKIAAGSKAVGLTDNVVTPLVNKVAASNMGQKVTGYLSDAFRLNNPVESAQFAYDATKASLVGQTKEGLEKVDKILTEAFPASSRLEVEGMVQRLVEAYPDIGQFARSADKVTARDTIINALFKDLEMAQGGLKAAKEASSKVGALTTDERLIAGILDANKISIDNIGSAVNVARNMGEVIPEARNMAQGIDEHIKIKKAAYKLIQSGKISNDDLPKLRGLFSDAELDAMMPGLKERIKNSPALQAVESAVAPVNSLSMTTSPKLNIASDGVLPKVRINNKPQPTVDLVNITEDGRRLLVSVENIPELAQKIKTEQDLQKQLNKVQRAREAIERADVSPEKTTQVLDSAMKAGYTPAEVEKMFNASEIMRGVNQIMTSEAMKRALIPLEAVGEFSGGRHLRRMYAALENPDHHYNNLLKSGNKEVADKFWEAYSKFDGFMKSKGISINMGTFESRKQLPKELQNQLGRLYEATYPFAKGNKMAAEQYAKHDFLKEVAAKHGSDVMKPGYKKVPVTPDGKMGALEGQFLPERVYKEAMFSVSKFDREMGSWEKNVQRWKALKLANPASIARNIMSGAVMTNVFGEVPFQKIPGLIVDTTTDMRKGTARYLAARDNGVFEVNIAKADTDAILSKVRGEKPGVVEQFDALLGWGMDVFSKPDSFWRMVVFNHHMDAGKTAQKAAVIAKRALLDYQNVPKLVEQLSRSGLVPFARFPFLATKETLRALWERPAQVTKYTKAQNQVNTDDRDKIMPDYLRAKTLLPVGEQTRIVNGKPQKVQGNIDLSYVLPFANDISVGNPIIDLLQLQRTGRNSIGQDVIKPSMTGEERAKVWAQQFWNGVGPAFPLPYNYAGERLYNAAQGNVDSKGRQYDMTQALLQTVGGIKNVPINIDELYRQKMGAIAREHNDIVARMREIQRESLNDRQRQERITDHQRQLKNLAIEARKVEEAYQREKKRQAQ
jgi:hypothetical protein